MKTKLVILAGILFLCAASVFAQGKAEANRVKFAKGKSSATLSGTLANNEEMEYVFGAKAGQTVTLKISSIPKEICSILLLPAQTTSNWKPNTTATAITLSPRPQTAII